MKSSSKNLLGEHNLKNHRSHPIKQKECCSKKQILFVKECLSRWNGLKSIVKVFIAVRNNFWRRY